MAEDHPVRSQGMKQDFLPKQALPSDGYTYSQGTRNFSVGLASRLVQLLGPISSGAAIHDNACGAGAGTIAIMQASPPAGINIYASDVAPAMVAPLEELVKEKNWPVHVTAPVSSENLDYYRDNFFDLSISSLIIQYTSANGVGGCKPLYRTLRPGGKAVVNCFETLPHWMPVLRTFEKAKSKLPPFPSDMIEGWSSGERLKTALITAGFAEHNINMTKVTEYFSLRDMKDGWQGLARFMWSTFGAVGGWTKEDEDKWDDAIQTLVKELRGMKEVEKDEEGFDRYPVRLHVAVATK